MSNNAVNRFWSSYVSKTDQSELKTLPFFHNTDMSSFEKVENNQWVLNANKKDKFHQSEKIFFFYGNPVYIKEYWHRPIVLGVRFKSLKKPGSISPTDTGLIMNLVKNDEVRPSQLGRDYYFDNLVGNVDHEHLIPTIKQYLMSWFGTVENYCSGRLKDEIIHDGMDCHFAHEKFVTHSPGDLFSPKFLKKNGLAFDKRRLTVELAIGGNVNLLGFCEVAFIGIPNNINNKSMKEKISMELDIQDPERIYEYDLNDEHGSSISLKDIMTDCIKRYHKIYDIKSEGAKL